jgi:hypothetical protein
VSRLIGPDQCRAPTLASNADSDTSGRHFGCRQRATVTTAKYNPHKIGCISRTNLLHDVGPVYFNSARVDTEAAANFLIGSTLGN